MNSTSALSSNPAVPGVVSPPQPAGAPARSGAAQEGEVLSVAELLQLLEQGAGFDQAMAGAGAPPEDAAALVFTDRRAEHERAADDEEDGEPCDVVTLLRLLEHSAVAPASIAAAASSAAAAPAATCDPTAAGAAAGGNQPPQPRASTPLADLLAVPPAAAAAAGTATVLAEAVMQIAAGGAAERRDSTPGTAMAPAGVTAAADPAQITSTLAQGLRAEMTSSAAVERSVHLPVRDPAWPQAIAAEIRFLADQKIEAATLRLSPEHLGPLEVRIDVRDGNVSVSFGVAHSETQAALEQALPRLRELFAAAGLQLGQATVQQEARRGSHNAGRGPAGSGNTADNGAGATPASVRALGLVDDYA
jgi:flagellar hook-length control protein FliK